MAEIKKSTAVAYIKTFFTNSEIDHRTQINLSFEEIKDEQSDFDGSFDQKPECELHAERTGNMRG